MVILPAFISHILDTTNWLDDDVHKNKNMMSFLCASSNTAWCDRYIIQCRGTLPNARFEDIQKSNT